MLPIPSELLPTPTPKPLFKLEINSLTHLKLKITLEAQSLLSLTFLKGLLEMQEPELFLELSQFLEFMFWVLNQLTNQEILLKDL
jgi:hypothetical protein